MTFKPCCKCKIKPRRKASGYCRECDNTYQRKRRKFKPERRVSRSMMLDIFQLMRSRCYSLVEYQIITDGIIKELKQ